MPEMEWMMFERKDITPILFPLYRDSFMCDFCSVAYSIKKLHKVGIGLFQCNGCREKADVATRSGMCTFHELTALSDMPVARSTQGSPLATGVAVLSFGVTSIRSRRWWMSDKFWDRRYYGDGIDEPKPASAARVIVDEIRALLSR